MIASAPAIEPATLTLPVKMKLSTKVSTLPVTLQLTALTIEREWEFSHPNEHQFLPLPSDA